MKEVLGVPQVYGNLIGNLCKHHVLFQKAPEEINSVIAETGNSALSIQFKTSSTGITNAIRQFNF